MNIAEFFENIQNPGWWKDTTVTWFSAAQYHAMFMHKLFEVCSKKFEGVAGMPFARLALMSNKDVSAALQQAFLGQRRCYFLGLIEELKRDELVCLRKLLSIYAGPHVVWAYTLDALTAKDLGPKQVIVELDGVVDGTTFGVIANFFGYERVLRRQQLVEKIFARAGSLSLDQAVMMMHYLSLLPIQETENVDLFLHRIIEPNRSLQRISALFFARRGDAFFELLADFKELYPPMFWVSFWSTQLWQAIHVIKYMQNQEYSKARRVGNRLPLSLLKDGWQKQRTHELARAHDFLCRIDFNLKNGCKESGINLFYTRFINGFFA